MVDFAIKFFGHARDEEQNSDKIWGWVEIEGKLYNFWGRRGSEEKPKSVSFKRNPNNYTGNRALEALTYKKTHPGGKKVPYREVPLTRVDDTYTEIEKVYPGFSTHFRKELMLHRLQGTVKAE